MQSAVALIELDKSHDECLYAQILFLKNYGIKVHLIVSQELYDRRLDALHGADFLEVLPGFAGRFAGWRTAAHVARYLRQQGLRQAVLNTAHGKLVRNLSLVASGDVELVGILHNAEKILHWSTTQAIISRKVKKYFVLNDYILREVRRRGAKSQVSSFYPIYFPMTAEHISAQGRYLVAIPGQLQFQRRDYAGLIAALMNGELDERIQFVLLGNSAAFDGPEIRRRVEQAGIQDRFVCFDQFISYSKMLGYLTACTVVLPLVHPATEMFDNYFHHQISGAFSLAQAVRKPMAMHAAFAGIDDFQRGAVFYGDADLVPCLNKLVGEPARLQTIEHELVRDEKYDFYDQARRYVSFLQPDRFRRTPGVLAVSDYTN